MPPKKLDPQKIEIFGTEPGLPGVIRPGRTSVFHRVFAKLIDLGIAVFLAAGFIYPVGILIALTYLFLGDALMSGQSIGKRLFGLSVIDLKTGDPITYEKSFIRNLPIGVPFFLSLIPVWGWGIALFMGVPMILLELTLIYKLSSSMRLGDVMAETGVIPGPSWLRDWKAMNLRKKREGYRRSGVSVDVSHGEIEATEEQKSKEGENHSDSTTDTNVSKD